MNLTQVVRCAYKYLTINYLNYIPITTPQLSVFRQYNGYYGNISEYILYVSIFVFIL